MSEILAFMADPDFYPSRIPDLGSRIPDPKTATKERGEKISCHTFLCSHKFNKIVIYFSFEVLKKKIWANFQRIIELFTKKNWQKALKNMVLGSGIRDPGSVKNLFRIPDSGSRGQKAPDPGSGSATLLGSKEYFLKLFVFSCQHLVKEKYEPQPGH
jgi:hypothetical protein